MRAFALFIAASFVAVPAMAQHRSVDKFGLHTSPATRKLVAYQVVGNEPCPNDNGGCFKYQIPGKPNRVSSKQDVMFCKAHAEPSSQPLNETNMSRCLLSLSKQRGEPVTNVFYDVEG